MHEMSLTESVLQILQDNAKNKGFERVKRVRLEIGELAGVEIEAMRFCFDVVMKGTLADQARLEIIQIPGQAWCGSCGKSVQVSQRFEPCPVCGGFQLQITGGEQMLVKELEVE